MNEAKRDAPRIADLLFGKDAFTDSRNVNRPEYLDYVRHAWTYGLQLPSGYFVSPAEWRQKFMDRVGEKTFWEHANAAFGLSPNEGLAMLKAVAEPQPIELPPPGTALAPPSSTSSESNIIPGQNNFSGPQPFVPPPAGTNGQIQPGENNWNGPIAVPEPGAQN